MDRRIEEGVVRIDRAEYASVLSSLKHLFLVGNLRSPTPHPFILDERIEVILCSYKPGDDSPYYWHRAVPEYEIVIDGKIGYFEVETGTIHWFQAGVFCAIPAGVCVKRLVREPVFTVAIKVSPTDE